MHQVSFPPFIDIRRKTLFPLVAIHHNVLVIDRIPGKFIQLKLDTKFVLFNTGNDIKTKAQTPEFLFTDTVLFGVVSFKVTQNIIITLLLADDFAATFVIFFSLLGVGFIFAFVVAENFVAATKQFRIANGTFLPAAGGYDVLLGIGFLLST